MTMKVALRQAKNMMEIENHLNRDMKQAPHATKEGLNEVVCLWG